MMIIYQILQIWYHILQKFISMKENLIEKIRISQICYVF